MRAAAGKNHRFNLASGVLIKDNHIAAARAAGIEDLDDVIAPARDASPHTMRIEIEVTSEAQLRQALQGGADVILLDNMSVDEIRACVGDRRRPRAHRGIRRHHARNVRAIAETGVDFISVGRLTHSAPALDISLELGEA